MQFKNVIYLFNRSKILVNAKEYLAFKPSLHILICLAFAAQTFLVPDPAPF